MLYVTPVDDILSPIDSAVVKGGKFAFELDAASQAVCFLSSQKVLDGNYDDRAKKSTAPKNSFNSFKGQHDYDFEALEKELFDNKPEPKTAGEDEEIRARAEALRQQLGGV